MNRIKELREINHETQEELGKILSVSKATISKYENGSVEVSNDTLIKLANHFRVTTDYLLGITNYNNITEKIDMTFGERLKKLRTEKGITQEKLGKIIGVSDRVIGYYEADNRFPKDDILLNKIADYFGVSLDYLLGRTNNNDIIQEIDKKLIDNNIAIAANSKVDLGKLAQADRKTAKLINTLLDDFLNDLDEDE